MDIRSLNEAFEKMFEGISEEETFNEEFDEQYASYVTDIDEDSEMMYKMYKTGNVSPADALTSLGYTDGEGDQMISEINSNGVNYVKVFDFNDDGSYTYYVLQDGKVPKGWTTTTAILDEEFLKEALESIVSKLDEAEMSDEDKQDSEHIRNMLDKMQQRSNASFSPEEKAVMNKYGITRDNGLRNLYIGDRPLDRRVDSKKPLYYGKQYSNGTKSKINYADRARKLPQRTDTQIFTGPSTLDNDEINAHGGSMARLSDLQDAERYAQDIPMRDKVTKMKDALNDRKYYQSNIDKADTQREAEIAAAQKKYDAAVDAADTTYKWNTETSAKYRDRAQDKIDTMLKRKPVEESVGGKWTEKAFAIVNDLDNTTELKDMLKKLLKDMSDKDVGEFLHQRGYIEYKD